MIRGWCPGVHEPMASGDGLLVRVKPPGGRLPAAALRAIADAASRCGNGVIELTSRGNLQVRGLTPATAPRFATAMVEHGLADPDPARESRRNVIPVPPCTDARVTEIEATLVEIPGLAPKFCVAIGPAKADLVVIEDTIWAKGQAYAYAPGTLRRLAENARGRRLTPAHPSWPGSTRPPTRTHPAGRADTPPDRPGLLLGLPFGQTTADALATLADLTDEARTTPWRAIHIPTPPDPAPFAAAGFITDPNDPRWTIAACPGAPSCASGTIPARQDAARLAATGLTFLHISGCAKGCAHPGPARTLVGRAGRYDLLPHGRASDTPTITGLTLDEAIAHLQNQPLPNQP